MGSRILTLFFTAAKISHQLPYSKSLNNFFRLKGIFIILGIPFRALIIPRLSIHYISATPVFSLFFKHVKIFHTQDLTCYAMCSACSSQEDFPIPFYINKSGNSSVKSSLTFWKINITKLFSIPSLFSPL
jgi:hypothetical protein